jgi:hypothetical protein
MANPKKGDAQLADASNKPMVGSQQALVADLTITYTTDDPGITPDSGITIADGDLFPANEGLIALEEVVAKVNAILDVLEAHGWMADS